MPTTPTVTKEIAVAASHGDEFHRGRCTKTVGPRGKVTVHQTRARVFGQCKTWARQPEKFKLPVRNGLYDCGYIEQYNCDDWHRAEDCPLLEIVPDRGQIGNDTGYDD